VNVGGRLSVRVGADAVGIGGVTVSYKKEEFSDRLVKIDGVLTEEEKSEREMVSETGSRAKAGLGKFTSTAVDRDIDAVSVYVTSNSACCGITH
jgi:hypothetical protein